LSVRSRTALAAMASMPLWVGLAPCQDSHDTRVHDRPRILAAVAAVRRAILAGDVAALLAHISKVERLGCTDTTYSREQVSAFLRDRSSHLYMSLFETPAFAKRCGREYPPEYPAISERDFLRSAGESIRVDPVEGEWVTVTLTSPVPTQYPRMWYFHFESGAWRLAGGSLVIGHCSCG
jgi:hypothetical protein